MNTIGFGDFIFDSGTLELYRCDKEVVLRPKTAALLRVLLQAQPEVLSKRDIIDSVWHTGWVSEQNLFQAISELRRALAPLKPIKTFPNKGYQWVIPVHSGVRATGTAPLTMHKPQPWARLLLVASVCAAILFAGVMIGISAKPSTAKPLTNAVASTQVRGLSPALMAFTNGLAKLELGQAAQAEHYFRLSVDENPEFLEAQLLLSEALLRQGRVDDARQRALHLVNRHNADQDTYTVIAAMDLISRSDQAAGQSSSAMEWALAAADQAHTEGFVCAAADLDARLNTLLAVAAISATGPNDSLDHERVKERSDRPFKNHADLQKTVSASIDLSSPVRCEQIRAPITQAPDRGAAAAEQRMVAAIPCAPEHLDGLLAFVDSARRPAIKSRISSV